MKKKPYHFKLKEALQRGDYARISKLAGANVSEHIVKNFFAGRAVAESKEIKIQKAALRILRQRNNTAVATLKEASKRKILSRNFQK